MSCFIIIIIIIIIIFIIITIIEMIIGRTFYYDRMYVVCILTKNLEGADIKTIFTAQKPYEN